MEQISSLLSQSWPSSSSVTDKRFEDLLNQEKGDLEGYDCPECKNRGYFWCIKGVERWTEECKCMTVRRNLTRMKKSGLGKMIDEYTFEVFQTQEPWQKRVFCTAQEYLDANEAWLYVSGQPGCGKTHLCTAVVRELMMRGEDVRYMRWVEDGQKIKYTDFGEREREIKPLQDCQVLYIDDFLKTQAGTKVDPREIRLAFEILNMRYGNRLKTIISSEFYIDEVMQMDEALGSRIASRAKGYNLAIKREKGRNWRLK